jgi:hypothetical protein
VGTQDDGQVVHQEPQQELATARPVVVAVHPRSESAFVLTEAPLGMPTLAVTLFGKVSLHQPAVVAGRGMRARSASGGRNDAAHAKVSAQETMMMLRIIPGVRQQLAEGHEGEAHHHRGTKLDVVGLGSLVGQAGKVEMGAGVAEDGKLGIVGFTES